MGVKSANEESEEVMRSYDRSTNIYSLLSGNERIRSLLSFVQRDISRKNTHTHKKVKKAQIS